MRFYLAILVLVLAFVQAKAALVYVPASFNAKTARVVVAIHGCLQSAETMALGTGWNQKAEKENLVIIYPQVPAGSNAIDCWSWYSPENQTAKSGQLWGVMQEVRSIRKNLGLAKANTYVNGISSGGATVAGLIACFPKEFKGAAIHSGPSYGLAKNLQEAESVLKMGPSEEKKPSDCDPKNYHGSLLVIQGDKDPVVNPKNAARIISDFGGEAKKSSRLVMIPDLGHEWSGAQMDKKISALPKFFSEKGPSATDMMWDFFKSN